jgi:enoyl-CoA hydratase/carnithine racemase
MAADLVLLAEQEGIAVVTINRPDKLNALNEEVIAGLKSVFQSCRTTERIRAVILTGAGEKAFVAGADISVLASLDPRTAKETAERGQQLTIFMESIGKPVIAAINGYAFGGGLELAMACTFRIAAEGAKMGQPEVKLGLLAGYGGTQRLPRLVGKGRALEMLLTGEPIDAAEAHRIGLVNRVVKREALLDEAKALAKKILAAGPIAVRMTIDAVNHGLDASLPEGLAMEAELFGQIASTSDMKEGTAAFLEKRPPKFTGK